MAAAAAACHKKFEDCIIDKVGVDKNSSLLVVVSNGEITSQTVHLSIRSIRTNPNPIDLSSRDDDKDRKKEMLDKRFSFFYCFKICDES